MDTLLVYAIIALLPIAAYSGFRIGRSYSQEKANPFNLNRRYFVGLNYLLNEQSDKAVDTFIDMLKVDSETIETHLALGSLFRKRGEVDKAIRLHQNLIARPNLSSDIKKLSLLELGLDYMAAGLYDRAESIFIDLKSHQVHRATSLRQLLIIYQQTRDWEKAANVAEQLQYVDNRNHAAEIANFYCELAELHKRSHKPKEAFAAIKRALQFDSRSVRAQILKGRFLLDEGHPKQAIKAFKEMVRQTPAFVSEVIEPAKQAYKQINDPAGIRLFLKDAIQQGGGISAVLALAELIQDTEDDRAAANYVSEQLREKPSLKGLLKLTQLHLKHAPESAKASFELLNDVVSRTCDAKPVYRCSHCGFSSKLLFWQCPSCKNWGTVGPILGLEGE